MANEEIKSIVERPEHISLSNLVALFTGFVYVSGYLVHSIFIRNRGIGNLELIRSQYIETGLVFVCITAFLIVVPYITTSMAFRARRKANQPLTFFVWVNPLLAINYLYLMLFFAFFITRAEWGLRFTFAGLNTSLQACATIYFAALFILIIITPAIRHLDLGDKGKFKPKISSSVDTTANSWFFFSLVNTLRALSLFLTIIFDYILWTRLQWMPAFASRAVYFVLCLLIVVISSSIVVYWSRPYEQRGLNNRFIFISLPFFIAFYLFTITTYTYGLYKNIPMSRGGKYPITQAEIRIKSSDALVQSGVVLQVNGEVATTKPLYVIEENNDFIYALQGEVVNWFDDTGPILALKKDDIISIKLSPVLTGAPRIRH